MRGPWPTVHAVGDAVEVNLAESAQVEILLRYGRNPPFGFLGDHAFLVLAFGFASDSGMAGKVCGVQSIGTRVGAAGSCDA